MFVRLYSWPGRRFRCVRMIYISWVDVFLENKLLYTIAWFTEVLFILYRWREEEKKLLNFSEFFVKEITESWFSPYSPAICIWIPWETIHMWLGLCNLFNWLLPALRSRCLSVGHAMTFCDACFTMQNVNATNTWIIFVFVHPLLKIQIFFPCKNICLLGFNLFLPTCKLLNRNWKWHSSSGEYVYIWGQSHFRTAGRATETVRWLWFTGVYHAEMWCELTTRRK